MLINPQLPNVRKLFLPDPGYLIADIDLDRADLQVVVWESNDDDLKAMLRLGVDMHCASACDIFNIPGIPVEELVETHPEYKEHRGRITELSRSKAKAGVHATNYYCQAKTLATTLGITIKEAQWFIDRWLDAHPGIRDWHERTETQLVETRMIRNTFGFRRFYFDRISTVLPEALAWIPQSTVAIVINKGLLNIDRNLPEVQPLLQVHDSIVVQFNKYLDPEIRPKIRDQCLITVPYDDPLVIPVGMKLSEKSWGDCAKVPWEAQEKVA
jgi:DNA polymerase-1